MNKTIKKTKAYFQVLNDFVNIILLCLNVVIFSLFLRQEMTKKIHTKCHNFVKGEPIKNLFCLGEGSG